MYQLNVFIHILMACIWVGGLIYTAAVVVPYAVKQEPGERQRVLRALGRKFRWIGWGAIILAVITGIGNLSLRTPAVKVGTLFNGEAFKAYYVGDFIATWLPWKLGLIAVMVLLMIFHDITSIRAAKKAGVDPASAPGNALGSAAAGIATLLALAIIYVSVRLVRG